MLQEIRVCKGICKMNQAKDLCIGCYRNTAEIGRWGVMSTDEKIMTAKICAIRENRNKGLQEV